MIAITDKLVLKEIARNSIDLNRVISSQDYGIGKGKSPYMKSYQEEGTRRFISVFSGLPMVDAFGQGHELKWADKDGTFESGNNIFHTIVKGLNTMVIALSDQPSGVKRNAELLFHPQLFVGTIGIKPISEYPKLLLFDPVNGNYSENTLEWDYGVCKRRLRLIEGKMLGSWVFDSKPSADITIKYNQSGDFKLHFAHAKNDDEEFIPASYFDRIFNWPAVISDSLTFNPDAHPETNSFDGHLGKDTNNMSWATARNSASADYAYDSVDTLLACAYFYTGTNSNTWYALYRGILLFYTAAFGPLAILSS